MKIIVMARPDGTMFTRTPVEPHDTDAETEEEYLARLASVNKKGATRVADMDHAELPADHARFKAARRWNGTDVEIDMPKAREIHAEHIATAQAAEIARLKVEERKERLKGNTAKANDHAATIIALEALNLNALATQITAVPNPTALKAIWPALLPKS